MSALATGKERPLPTSPFPLHGKGEEQSGAPFKGRYRSFTPSLARSAGEGWGGVFLPGCRSLVHEDSTRD